jgi:hypothetical protein
VKTAQGLKYTVITKGFLKGDDDGKYEMVTNGTNWKNKNKKQNWIESKIVIKAFAELEKNEDKLGLKELRSI